MRTVVGNFAEGLERAEIEERSATRRSH
jgi:hypothetical protein